jgi:hypothetical protein
VNFVYLATEDMLSETVGKKLVNEHFGSVDIIPLRKAGFGYLKGKVGSFIQLARKNLVIVLTDLDAGACAATLIEKWFGKGTQLPDGLIFRVAVREIESWVMSDHKAFADFLDIDARRLARDPDGLVDPKRELLRLARGAPRELRGDLLPLRGAPTSQGLGYNARLSNFVATAWDSSRARTVSGSLNRACSRLAEARKLIEQ